MPNMQFSTEVNVLVMVASTVVIVIVIMVRGFDGKHSNRDGYSRASFTSELVRGAVL